jgi:hypothetical protein
LVGAPTAEADGFGTALVFAGKLVAIPVADTSSALEVPAVGAPALKGAPQKSQIAPAPRATLKDAAPHTRSSVFHDRRTGAGDVTAGPDA